MLEHDGVDRPLGGSRIDGRDRGHHLALEAHDVASEQAAVLHERPVAHVGHVVGGEHGVHSGEGASRGDVDAGDAGVADVGVAELGDEHAGERQVGRVPTAARHLVGPVGPHEAW